MIQRSYIDEFQPSLDDLKRHLRITSNDLDETLEVYLLAAIESAEHLIGKIIALSEFTYTGWFVRSFDMKGPWRKVVKIEVDGVELSEADYTVDKKTILISQEIQGREMTVVYESGMSQVPFDMKAAIMLAAAKLFNNPADTVESLPSVAKNLLRPYRSYGIDDDE